MGVSSQSPLTQAAMEQAQYLGQGDVWEDAAVNGGGGGEEIY